MVTPILAGHCHKVVSVDETPHILAGMVEMTRRRCASEEAGAHQGGGVMFSPAFGSIERAIHCLLELSASPWDAASRILLWQLDEDIPYRISVEMCSADVHEHHFVGVSAR